MKIIKKIVKHIIYAKNWRDHQVEKQEKLPKNVDSELTIEEIEVIRSSLEDQVFIKY